MGNTPTNLRKSVAMRALWSAICDEVPDREDILPCFLEDALPEDTIEDVRVILMLDDVLRLRMGWDLEPLERMKGSLSSHFPGRASIFYRTATRLDLYRTCNLNELRRLRCARSRM